MRVIFINWTQILCWFWARQELRKIKQGQYGANIDLRWTIQARPRLFSFLIKLLERKTRRILWTYVSAFQQGIQQALSFYHCREYFQNWCLQKTLLWDIHVYAGNMVYTQVHLENKNKTKYKVWRVIYMIMCTMALQ